MAVRHSIRVVASILGACLLGFAAAAPFPALPQTAEEVGAVLQADPQSGASGSPVEVLEAGSLLLLDEAGSVVIELGTYEIRLDLANLGEAHVRILQSSITGGGRFEGSIDEGAGGFDWSFFDSADRHLTSGSFTYDGGVVRSAEGGVDGDWTILADCQSGSCIPFESPHRERVRLVASSSNLPALDLAPAATTGSRCDAACREHCVAQGSSGGVFDPRSGAVCLIGRIRGAAPAQACSCS